MKEQQRLEKVLNEAYKSVQQEISSLTGAEMVLGEPQYSIQSKEDAFESLASKQVCSKIDVRGDIEGDGCLLIPIKDAIKLGGILIMLPDSELAEFVSSENFSDEIQDSYGEIANIAAGAYSKAFEDLYPKSCRLIRKEQEVLAPAKVDIDSDEPVINQQYFITRQTIGINGEDGGDMVLMLPAVTFGLAEVPPVDDAEPDIEKPEAQEAVEVADDEQALSNEEQTTEVDAEPEAPPSNILPYDPKNIERLDKVIEGSQSLLAEEVAGLIGSELVLAGHSCEFMKKEELLEDLNGKQVAATMDVRGDFEGQGALFVDLKGAIRLGGTLIMLPQTELEEVVGRGEYNEETEDSYGEIANIIAGSYSKVFEDLYPKSCRLIRKEQEVVTPIKLEVTDQKPLPDQLYYVVKNAMTLDGSECGDLVLALPALAFGLVSPDEQPSSQEKEEKAKSQISKKAESSSQNEVDSSPESTADQPVKPVAPSFDSEKQKAKVDNLLGNCEEKMREEVSAMLGTEVKLTPVANRIIDKEELFYEQLSGKQVLAHVDITGEIEDKSYLLVNLKDAVRIGGILIMLPPNELDQFISDEEYSDDINDAYGEIANIIAGVYSGVFEEQFSKKIRFVRKELETVAPMKVDIGSNEPMPDKKYYLHCLKININGQDLGELQMVIPAEVLQLELLGEQQPVQQKDKEEKSDVPDVESRQVPTSVPNKEVSDGGSSNYDVLVIGNNSFEIQKISSVLHGKGFVVRELSFKDNVNNYITPGVKAVFLVMQEVNELGFGIAIKIASASSKPLIAAGSDWTRTKVIKAVKYGVKDILLTPASDQDISEKLENNLVKLAA